MKQLTHEAVVHDLKIAEIPEEALQEGGELMLSIELVAASRSSKNKNVARSRVVRTIQKQDKTQDRKAGLSARRAALY